MQLQLDSRYEAIVQFIADASANDVPPVVQAYLYRFGTVLVCGYIERSVEIIVTERLKKKAQPQVLNFIRSHFKRGQNLNAGAVSDLLNRFDADWYRKFEAFVAGDASVKEGVASCYGLRNAIAHGGTATVTQKRLTELLDASRKMINSIVDATK